MFVFCLSSCSYFSLISGSAEIIKTKVEKMRILIAEDETTTAKALKILLEKENYSVDIVFNGNDAWNYVSMVDFDVVVLDIMMPGIDGLEVLKRIRDAKIHTPVMMLSAKSEIEDKILGLDMGADDYLPKPFSTGELIARIKALARRNETYTEDVITIGNMTLDTNRFEIRAGERVAKLNNKEFQLMELFVSHPGYVFSSEHLMEKIWGLDSDSNIDVVWTYIGFIRKKMKSIGTDVEVKTIRGAGYTLEDKTC